MFNNVYMADFKSAFSGRLIFFLVSETVLTFLLGSVFLLFSEKNHRVRGAYIQALYRSNIAVIGVALAQVLMDADGVASMTIAITILVPIFNVLAVIALELCRGQRISVWKTLRSIIKNPLVIGALIGMTCVLLQVRVPTAAEAAAVGIARAASVMTVISLGASFQFSGIRKNRMRLAAASSFRLVLIPLAVVTAAINMGFRDNDLSVILICAASPLATTSFPMAQVYDSDYELTGQLVVFTSLLCCFTLFLWIFALKQLDFM